MEAITLREDIMIWEGHVKEYEDLEGHVMTNDMKIGILLKALPSTILQHLFMNAASYDRNYEAMRHIVDMFIISSGRWATSPATASRQEGKDGVADMEVDAIQKGQRGKGAGRKGGLVTGKGEGAKGTGSKGQKGVTGSGRGQGKDGQKGSGPLAQDACRICGRRGHWTVSYTHLTLPTKRIV